MLALSQYGHVDWITATAPYKLRASVELDVALAFDSVQRIMFPREEVKRGTWMSYSGFRVPHLFWGRNSEGVCLRASGEAAEGVWRLLDWPGIRVPRLDLAWDIWWDADYDQFAQACADDAEKARLSLPPARRRKLCLVDGMGDGDTLYLGSRKSDQFGRLYDKARESGSATYRNCWRAEVEFHDSRAGHYFRELQKQSDPSKAIAETVAQWFEVRGVQIPASTGVDSGLNSPPSRDSTDVDRSCHWLASQVAPALVRLLRYKSRTELDKILWDDDTPL